MKGISKKYKMFVHDKKKILRNKIILLFQILPPFSKSRSSKRNTTKSQKAFMHDFLCSKSVITINFPLSNIKYSHYRFE